VDPPCSPSARWLGKTAAKAAHEQVRARERGRGERDKRDEGRERDDQDGDHGELRDDQEEEHGPVEAGAGDPFDSVVHAIERPAARGLVVTRAPRRTVMQPATAPAVAASTTIDTVI
jgi:hypothetical protein